MAVTTETEQLLKDRKTFVMVKNFAGRLVEVNLDKARRMEAQDGAKIISKAEFKEMEKALAQLERKTTKK